jgi:predicted dehydrogenase
MLLDLATEKQLKVTVGHDAQFSPAARVLRQSIKQGYLGGDVVHMESHYGYELGNVYGNALLENKQHWVRRLPGKLLQNVISHGIAHIAEFLVSDNPQVHAYGFVSPLLRSVGEDEIVDELRVVIIDQEQVTAYFTFSSQMRPSLHQFRIYGPKNGLFLDEPKQIVLRLKGERYKSYAERFLPCAVFAKQFLGNLRRNARLFIANDFHMEAGKHFLIEAFYRSISNNAPLPISYREILRTSRMMEAIFEQIDIGRSRTMVESRREAGAMAQPA